MIVCDYHCALSRETSLYFLVAEPILHGDASSYALVWPLNQYNSGVSRLQFITTRVNPWCRCETPAKVTSVFHSVHFASGTPF